MQWRSHTRACPGTGPGNFVLGPGNNYFESGLKFNCMSTWQVGLTCDTMSSWSVSASAGHRGQQTLFDCVSSSKIDLGSSKVAKFSGGAAPRPP